MTVFAQLSHPALIHKFQTLQRYRMRQMASDAARRVWINLVPLREIKMIVIRPRFACARGTFINFGVALGARVIAEWIRCDGGVVIFAKNKSRQVMRALL